MIITDLRSLLQWLWKVLKVHQCSEGTSCLHLHGWRVSQARNKQWANSLNIVQVGFEVLTAVVMKSSFFRDITRYSQLKVNRRFRGTCRLHRQGRRKGQARNYQDLFATCFHDGFLFGFFFDPEDEGDTLLRNVDSFFSRLHGVISQTTELLMEQYVHPKRQ
jgi:hypothetical protein